MRKRFSRNEKGTVLLTVICFTTMCMVIAAIALRISDLANKRSTQNVMRAQAQITAEHYLEQYLSTFKPDATTNRISFEKLSTIAGADESAANKITISLQKPGSVGSDISISDDSLDKTAEFGGNCTLYVYRQGTNGIVVKAVATYAEQTGLASAYFYQESPTIDLNKNAIETVNNFVGQDFAVPVTGDMMLEVNLNETGNKFITNHNSTGVYNSNVYVNTTYKMGNGTTKIQYCDTVQGYAPTITALGNIIIEDAVITTTVGKSDKNGLRNDEKLKDDAGNIITDSEGKTTDYNPSNLTNKNGYINTDKKLFVAGLNGGESKIGSAAADSKHNNDIDIYCCGGVFGQIPDTSYRLLDKTTMKKVDGGAEKENEAYSKWVKEITEDYGFKTGGRSGTGDIYGSVFSRQKSNDNLHADGTLIFNEYFGGQKGVVTIHGDLLVEGDLILYSKIVVTGNIYCDNIINLCEDESTASNYKGSKTSVSTWDKLSPKMLDTATNSARSKTPDMEYAPGLYDPKTRPNPHMTHTSAYLDKTPNNMYAKNDKTTKFMANNFKAALEADLKEASDFTGNLNEKITIKKSCYLTADQVSNSNTKYFVDVQDEDIWLLMPVTPGASSNTISCRIISNNKTGGKHHCYVCFYNSSAFTGDPTKINLEDPAVLNAIAKFYLSENKENVKIHVNNTVAWASSKLTTDFNKAIDKKNIGNYTDLNTNLIVLIPDGFDMSLYENSCCYNAIFYGPKANLTLNTSAGATLLGQAKVGTFSSTDDTSHAVAYNDIADGSILHSFLTDASSNSGSVFFQYYVRHKD